MDMMQRLSQAGVSDAVHQWRNEAGHLRTAASAAHLRPPQKAMLLREADAADRQADWWSDCLVDGFAERAEECTRPVPAGLLTTKSNWKIDICRI